MKEIIVAATTIIFIKLRQLTSCPCFDIATHCISTNEDPLNENGNAQTLQT
jgi:hypothetical protein